MIKIYIITNTINEKKYVGQTTHDLESRFKRHCWKSEIRKNMPITQAINKYGKEYFKISEIDCAESVEKANELEVFWAKFHNAFSPNGYNLKAGGRKHMYLSSETKEKISSSNKGKTITEETRKRLSESHKGYIMADSTKLKLSNLYKGKKPHENTALGASTKNAKSYTVISPEGESFIINNMRKFSITNKLCLSAIHRVLNGDQDNHKGWKFSHLMDNELQKEKPDRV